jgi:hypothetical protein
MATRDRDAGRYQRLLGHIEDDDQHPGEDLVIDMKDPAKWTIAADWLHDRAHSFLDAITKVFVSP